jgi:hypothetical protein
MQVIGKAIPGIFLLLDRTGHKDGLAYSMPPSYSDKFRGGVYANTLLEAHANDYCTRARRPGPIVNGSRSHQEDHDFGIDTSHQPKLRVPHISHDELIKPMQASFTLKDPDDVKQTKEYTPLLRITFHFHLFRLMALRYINLIVSPLTMANNLIK